jgi:hypothetical protein
MEHLRADAVDLGEQLRRLGVEQGEDTSQPGRLVAGDHDLGRSLLEGLQALPAAILDHHLETTGIADAAHRRRRNSNDEAFLDGAKTLCEITEDAAGTQSLANTVFIGSKNREDRCGVRSIGKGCAVQSSEAGGVDDPRRLQHDLGRLLHDLVRARQGRPRRELHDRDEIAFILGWNEAGWRPVELPTVRPIKPA